MTHAPRSHENVPLSYEDAPPAYDKRNYSRPIFNSRMTTLSPCVPFHHGVTTRKVIPMRTQSLRAGGSSANSSHTRLRSADARSITSLNRFSDILSPEHEFDLQEDEENRGGSLRQFRSFVTQGFKKGKKHALEVAARVERKVREKRGGMR
jgi:hypothetical protein